jgi:hypothetical protein
VRALLAALALSLAACASCGSCEGDSARSDKGGATSADDGVGAPLRTLAVLPGPVDALAAGRGDLFGISRSLGLVFAISEEGDGPGALREIAKGEREPSALATRAGKPVWASQDGVFVSDEDGGNRKTLVGGRAVRCLGSGPHDILFCDEKGIWRIEWPAASTPIQVVDEVVADEVVGTVEHVVWLTHGKGGKVWAFDLKSRTRRELGDLQRKPHDLSLSNDGHSVFWHEGEADLLPGRNPMAFLADTVTGSVRELAGAYESSSAYLLHGPCVFGPGECKPLAQVDWITLGHGSSGGTSDRALAADSAHLFWVEEDRAGEGETWRIVSTPLSFCCR